MPVTAASEVGGTPSEIMKQQHPGLPLALGGGGESDTSGQQHVGPPASDVIGAYGTR